MGYQKSSLHLATLSIALCVAFTPLYFQTPQLGAQPLYVSIKFPRTPVGSPRSSIGGATRSPISCLRSNSTLIVLSPQSNVITTVSAQPTFFWYIPKTPAKSAKFVVSDQQGQLVYQTTLTLKGIPGVVKLSLPKNVALDTGQEYDWKFGLTCNPDNESENIAVEGSLKRTGLTSAQRNQLAAAKQPLKKAEVYAKAGIWQETISILAQLRHDRPSDRNINAAWKELLESVELKEIANAPLVECCRADN
ncbi:DUF928 domain-containing protein [Allocoleopsis sp.]|uniref:DUF928 domain-containing protein n=1 Tax=Allocoleopsis sp. TaxID=3088169 RepID=UPI002FD72AFA